MQGCKTTRIVASTANHGIAVSVATDPAALGQSNTIMVTEGAVSGSDFGQINAASFQFSDGFDRRDAQLVALFLVHSKMSTA